jgi:hypothetical protein
MKSNGSWKNMSKALAAAIEKQTIEKDDVVQIIPPHRWGGCFAIVSEPRKWGCVAYIPIPVEDKVSEAYIRLEWHEFERMGKAIFVASE